MTVSELFDFLQATYGSAWQSVVNSHGGIEQARADWSALPLEGLTLRSKPIFKLRDTHNPLDGKAPTLDEFAALLRGDWGAAMSLPSFDQVLDGILSPKPLAVHGPYHPLHYRCLELLGSADVAWMRSRIKRDVCRPKLQTVYKKARNEAVCGVRHKLPQSVRDELAEIERRHQAASGRLSEEQRAAGHQNIQWILQSNGLV